MAVAAVIGLLARAISGVETRNRSLEELSPLTPTHARDRLVGALLAIGAASTSGLILRALAVITNNDPMSATEIS